MFSVLIFEILQNAGSLGRMDIIEDWKKSKSFLNINPSFADNLTDADSNVSLSSTDKTFWFQAASYDANKSIQKIPEKIVQIKGLLFSIKTNAQLHVLKT